MGVTSPKTSFKRSVEIRLLKRFLHLKVGVYVSRLRYMTRWSVLFLLTKQNQQ